MKQLWLALLCGSAACGLVRAEASPAPALPEGLYAEFVTPHGTILCELFFRQAPLTVANFVGLAEGSLGPQPGRPYFNDLKFHRVVPGFVVQGGDPTGTGRGGPGYTFPDEFVPGLKHNEAGILSMANSGPDSNGSQFFLTLREVNRLNYLHSVFGRAVRGREVLPRIGQDDPMTAVNILRIGAAAQAFRADQTAFDALVARTPRHAHAHFEDPDRLLPLDPPRARHFDFKLANFERFTGIPLYVHLRAKYEPEYPEQRPGRAARDLVRRLALPPGASLALYFADTDEWGLWIGEDQVARFLNHPEAAPADANAALRPAKHAFLAAVRAQAAAFVATAEATATPDRPLTDAQRIKLKVDAMVDALLVMFEPTP